MSMIEHAIAASRKHTAHHDPSLANKPAPKMAILTCMDPRLNDSLRWLDIAPADADVIRNVGNPRQRKMSCGLFLCFRFMFWACCRAHDNRAHRLRKWKCFRKRSSRTTSTRVAACGPWRPINSISIPDVEIMRHKGRC